MSFIKYDILFYFIFRLLGKEPESIKEYQQQKARGEHGNRMERQRARRGVDKKMPDNNGNGKADKREGKDVSHVKALDKGGSNKDGLRIQSAAKNRSFKRDSQGNLVSETSKKERKNDRTKESTIDRKQKTVEKERQKDSSK